MKLVPVIVKTYSGDESEENPGSFVLEGEEYPVTAIIDRWYQGDKNPEFPAADYFKVETESRETYMLRHEVGSDKWYLVDLLD